MEFDSEPPFLIEGYLNGIDFVVIYDMIPAPSWWADFPFDRRGIDFRDEPSELPGWKEFAPFLGRVRYLSLTQPTRDRRWDLEFLALTTQVELLAVPPARRAVDVSHLPLKWFHGSGQGLQGLFELATLTSVTFYKWMPEGTITAPISDLRIIGFSQSFDLSLLASPSSLQSLVFAKCKTVDLSVLAKFPLLSSLVLTDCAFVAGAEALSTLRVLRRLVMVDCPDFTSYPALAGLSRVEVEIGGSNVFDDEFRLAVQRGGDSSWSFPDILPPRAGESWYLIHPGLARALRIPDQVDDGGPGESVTDRWESAGPLEQQRMMRNFLMNVQRWLTDQGVKDVEVASNGPKKTSFDSFHLMDLDESESVDLRFIAANGAVIAKISETVWDGIAIQAPRRPAMRSFR